MKGAPRDIGDVFAHLKIPLRFEGGAIPNIEPRENIYLTDVAPIVRAVEGGAELAMMRWSWIGGHGKPVFNFRSEGRRFAGGRCLILADGYYEFIGAKAPKSKWLFTVRGAPIFALAGYVREGAFTMLTTNAGPDIPKPKDRQPVVLEPENWTAWLSHEPNETALLRPSLAGTLEAELVRS